MNVLIDLVKNGEKINEVDIKSFIEVKCSIGARDNLGRPTTTPQENKNGFMDYLQEH